jgi:Secretion system C-terminal sorting domain
MKKSITAFCFFTACISVYSQNWLSHPCNWEVRGFALDSANNKLFACGGFSQIGGLNTNSIAAYDGTSWYTLGNGCGTNGGISYSTTYFENKLFVGGDFLINGTYEGTSLVYWDGNDWNFSGHPNQGSSIGVANGNLFAIGYYDSICNAPIGHVSRWDGSCWEAFGTETPDIGIAWTFDRVAFYKGSYYFGGIFHDLLGPGWNHIISWDGDSWEPLNNRITGSASWVNDLMVYKGILFVAGGFTTAEGNVSNNLMAWDGANWFNPFPSVNFEGQVLDLEIIEDKLYLLGNHNAGTPQNYLMAKYDGQIFCSFGDSQSGPQKIAGLNGRLFMAGGYFYNPTDTVRYLAEWIGGTTTDICITQPIAIEKPILNDPKITLSPNPTNGVFEITLSCQSSTEIKIQITDVTGRIVAQQTAAHAGAEGKVTVPFDLSHCAPGVYFGRVDPIAIGCGDGLYKGFKVVVE